MSERPIYAVGDIHGHSEKLDDALARIDADGGAAARVVFIGDLIDRGPDSAGVIERLARGIAEGRDWICIKGNHDRFLEWFLADPSRCDPYLTVGHHWLHPALGGRETLASYGVDVPERIRIRHLAERVREAVPPHHREFLSAMRLMHREGDLLFVHAGIRPGVPLDAQEEEDLLWIREPFLDDPRDHGVFVVHGHTPVPAPDLRANRIDIDTGAAFGGPLTVAVFDGDDVFALEPGGRRALGRWRRRA